MVSPQIRECLPLAHIHLDSPMPQSCAYLQLHQGQEEMRQTD